MSHGKLAIVRVVLATLLVATSSLLSESSHFIRQQDARPHRNNNNNNNNHHHLKHLEQWLAPAVSDARALPIVEPIEYKVSMALLERLSYIAGSAEILVKFRGIPTPPPMPPRSIIMSAYKRRILPVVARLRNRANAKQRGSSRISLSLDDCYHVDSVEMIYARSLDDLMKGNAVKVDTGYHDGEPAARRGRIEFEPELGGIRGVPTDGVAKITIVYRDASENPSRSTCERAKTMLTTRGLSVLKPDRCSQVMPCFDVPNSKAKVSVALTIDSHGRTRILTNMPPMSAPAKLGYEVISLMEQQFRVTPKPIPMDELVFISSRFDEPLVGSRTSLAVPFGRRPEAEFAFQLLQRAFDWFEEYTQYEHPLGHYQLAIVPTVSDSWDSVRALGISTIMPLMALMEPGTSSRELKIGAAIQVGYEVASQWFGTIVKPRGESDAWLTEGLAAHMTLRMIDSLMPELQIYQYFSARISPQILKLETERKLPPIATADTSQSDPDFLSMRSFKSAAIIDILAHSVARKPERFDTILRHIIERRANTDGITLDDLVELLENRRFSQEQVRGLLEPWIHSSGFPVVRIAADEQGRVCLIQANDQAATIWPLALNVKYSNGNDDATTTTTTPTQAMRISIKDFIRHNGVVCLPSAFSTTPDSSAWIEVHPEAQNSIRYFRVEHPTLNADLVGRLRVGEILEARARGQPDLATLDYGKPDGRINSEQLTSHQQTPSYDTDSGGSSSSSGSSSESDDEDAKSEVESPLRDQVETADEHSHVESPDEKPAADDISEPLAETIPSTSGAPADGAADSAKAILNADGENRKPSASAPTSDSDQQEAKVTSERPETETALKASSN